MLRRSFDRRRFGACARTADQRDGECALRAARDDAPDDRAFDARWTTVSRLADDGAFRCRLLEPSAGCPAERSGVGCGVLCDEYGPCGLLSDGYAGRHGWLDQCGGAAITNPGQWLFTAVGSNLSNRSLRGAEPCQPADSPAQQEEALVNFRQSLLTAGAEVNDALVQWQTARRRLELDRQQIEALQSACGEPELLMQYSSQNYLEVLTARQSLLQAELDAASDCFDRIQGVINLTMLWEEGIDLFLRFLPVISAFSVGYGLSEGCRRNFAPGLSVATCLDHAMSVRHNLFWGDRVVIGSVAEQPCKKSSMEVPGVALGSDISCGCTCPVAISRSLFQLRQRRIHGCGIAGRCAGVCRWSPATPGVG